MMPKLLDMAVRRAALAAAAIRAIDARGLEGVRLVDVAAEAGCTTGALQHFFGVGAGKDAVLRLALEEIVERMLSAPSDPGRSPAEQLAESLPLDEARRREWRVWIAFQGRALFDRALAALHGRYYAAIHDRLVEALAGAGVPAHRLDAVALAAVAAVDGVGLRASLEPELWPPQRQREMLAALLDPLFASHPEPKP